MEKIKFIEYLKLQLINIVLSNKTKNILKFIFEEMQLFREKKFHIKLIFLYFHFLILNSKAYLII